MNRPARRAAIVCALLTSTCIAAPAAAQTAQPSIYQHVDANGVDLVNGSFNFALTEGTIGSGVGAIALTRYQSAGGASDNLTVTFRRSVTSGSASFDLVFGNRRETFAGSASASSWGSGQGNGGTLTKIAPDQYRYTSADGTVTVYGPPPNLMDAANNGYCSTVNESSCWLVAVSTTRPDGAVTTYQWDTGQNCTTSWDRNGEPVQNCAQFWRQRGLSNNSGYRIRFSFQQEANPTSGLPSTAWHTRTGATLYNDAVAGAPARTVSYSTPATGVTDITTDGGDTWRITRDSNLYVVGIRRPGSSSDNVAVAYSAPTSGVVSSVTADGVTTSYSRSVSGSTGTMTVTNALNQQTTVVSDLAIGRPTAVTDALGRTSTAQYDAAGRLTRSTAPEGNYTQLSYDARGNVIQTTLGAKPGSPEAAQAPITTSASYPASCSNVVTCNRPLSTTDARGFVTDYSYDQTHGGVLSVTAPAVTVNGQSVRPQVRTTYAQVGGIYLPTQVSACQTGASCAGTTDEVRSTVTYGTNHLPVSASSGNGAGTLTATTAMTYDSAGDVITVDGPLAGTADTVRYRYDAARRRVGTVSPDPDGTGPLPPRAVRTTYRPDGQVSRVETGIVNSQSDADWAAMVVLEQADTSFDSNGRPVVGTHSAGGSIDSVVQTSYDAIGRPDCTAQRMNPANWLSLPASACTPLAAGSYGPDRIGRTIYNTAGQAVQAQTAVGTPIQATVSTATYSANGRLLTLTDGENNRTSYEYDGHDRLRRSYFPLAAQGATASNAADYEELSYDLAGNVVTRRLRDGQAINYVYDALGRVTLKDLPGTEPDVSYTYDLLGRMLSASVPSSFWGTYSINRTWDALGRLTSEGNQFHGTRSFVYDLAGRRTLTSWGDGFSIDYEYLVTGETRRIGENPYTGSSTVAVFGYDYQGRRTSLTRGNGTSTSYQYDAASRLTQLSHDFAGTAYDVTTTYAYNPAGQLVSSTRSNDLYSYSAAAGTQTTPANGLNQASSVNANAATYDARGNMTGDGSRSFTYDSENRLVGAPPWHGFGYDPLGRYNYSWYNNDGFDYEGHNLITERSGTLGPVRRRYVHANSDSEPLAWYEGDWTADRRWLHADEHGSIVAISDAAGNVIAVNRYDDYGAPQNSNLGRFEYAGQPLVFESGTYYLRARMYNPYLGRFLQPDPIGYGDGMNIYAYVGGDPVNRADPSGLAGEESEEAYEDVDDPKPIEVIGHRGGSGGGSGGSTHGILSLPAGAGLDVNCVLGGVCILDPFIVATGPRRTSQRQRRRPFTRPRFVQRRDQPQTQRRPDYCGGGGQTWPPESIFGADISVACAAHDRCYGSSTDRVVCDRHLATNIAVLCELQLRPPSLCALAGTVYLAAVGTRGRRLYTGTGDPR